MLTRDEGAIEAYARALAPLGLDAIALPVTYLGPPAASERARLATAVAALEDYDAIVVASAHAAAALLEVVGEDRLAGADAPRLWAVGPATAAVLTGRGLAVSTPTDADARGLAAAMIAAGPLRRVLAPRAAGGRDEGLAALVAAGVAVDAIDAYQTLATPADAPTLTPGLTALADDGVALALFAPSQVAALDALLAARGGIAALTGPRFAIGATTAAALRAIGARCDAIATSPTPAGLARAIASATGRPSRS